MLRRFSLALSALFLITALHAQTVTVRDTATPATFGQATVSSITLTAAAKWTSGTAPTGNVTFTVDGSAFSGNSAALTLPLCVAGDPTVCTAQATVVYPVSSSIALGVHAFTASVASSVGSGVSGYFTTVVESGSFTVGGGAGTGAPPAATTVSCAPGFVPTFWYRIADSTGTGLLTSGIATISPLYSNNQAVGVFGFAPITPGGGTRKPVMATVVGGVLQSTDSAGNVFAGVCLADSLLTTPYVEYRWQIKDSTATSSNGVAIDTHNGIAITGNAIDLDVYPWPGPAAPAAVTDLVGPPGTAAVISSVTTNVQPPGCTVGVTNNGTTTNAELEFTLCPGVPGVGGSSTTATAPYQVLAVGNSTGTMAPQLLTTQHLPAEQDPTTLNGSTYADKYNTATGSAYRNGIYNFISAQSAGPGAGIHVIVPPTYPASPAAYAEEPHSYPYLSNSVNGTGGCWDQGACGNPGWPVNAWLDDDRDGVNIQTWNNPVNRFAGAGISHPLNYPGGAGNAGNGLSTVVLYDVDYGNANQIGVTHTTTQLCCGHNTNYGSGQGKSNLEIGNDSAYWWSQGQHALWPQTEICTGMGDCMGSPITIKFSNGLRDNSDEGTHPGDAGIGEDPLVFQGICTTDSVNGATCTTGSQLILACANNYNENSLCGPVSGGHGQDNQGDGRMAIDISKASAGGCSGCTLVAGVGTGNQIISTGGGSGGTPNVFTAGLANTFAVSTGIGTLNAAITAAAGNKNPGVQTIAITTSQGTFAPGVVTCVFTALDYEQVIPTAASSTSLTANFTKGYPAGAMIAQGGTCGWGIALNADTTPAFNTATYPGVSGLGSPVDDIRTLIPLFGSPDATHTYFNTFNYTGYRGRANYQTSTATATYSASTGLVTVTCGGCAFTYGSDGLLPIAPVMGTGQWGDPTGTTSLALSGSSDPGYSGNPTVTVTQYTTFTYTPATAPTAGDYGPVTITVTECAGCSFTLYPRAEVLSVYDQTRKLVDGTLALEPNNIAFAVGDVIEEPHWDAPALTGTHNTTGSWTPQIQSWGYGMSYDGHVTGDLTGFSINNFGGPGGDGSHMNYYLGFGGFDTPPAQGFRLIGWWNDDFSIPQAPNDAVFRIGCKPNQPGTTNGCTRWNAPYFLYRMITAGGELDTYVDTINSNYDFQNSVQCNVQIGANIGTVGGAAYGGAGSQGGSHCGFLASSLVLQASPSTPLTSTTGSGSAIVTNNSPTIVGPVTASGGFIGTSYAGEYDVTCSGASCGLSTNAALTVVSISSSVTGSTLVAQSGANGYSTILDVCNTSGSSVNFTLPTNVRGITSPTAVAAGKCNSFALHWSNSQSAYLAQSPGVLGE